MPKGIEPIYIKLTDHPLIVRLLLWAYYALYVAWYYLRGYRLTIEVHSNMKKHPKEPHDPRKVHIYEPPKHKNRK